MKTKEEFLRKWVKNTVQWNEMEEDLNELFDEHLNYSALIRKSDAHWMYLGWDFPVGIFETDSPQFFDTTINELSLQWKEFNPDRYIDWSLYELVPVYVIPVNDIK
jgi:hypothetical protein